MPPVRHSLRVELADGESFTHDLALARTVVGRASSCDLPLKVDGVSREHAALLLEGGVLEVEDLGSTNGTRVNGAPVAGRTRLRDGDQVGIGRALLTVLVDARQDVEARTPDGTDPPGGASILATVEADGDAAPLAGDQRALRALYRLGHAFDAGAPPGALARRAVELAAEALGAERALLRAGDQEARLGGLADPPAEVVARVTREGRAILSVDGERAIVAAPVPAAERGMLYAEAPAARRRFTPAELDLLTVLANQTAALLENARLVAELRDARDRLAAENADLRDALGGRLVPGGMIGGSAKLREVQKTLAKLAQTDTTVLITGESGTGKELAARTVHENSPRKRAPFVAINCAAIPENLIEAELFGIERGVATGVDRRAGKFEAAEGGTLFLDEVGELPAPAQAKLLRVLQERVVERVGGRTAIPVRARIVAATNRSLAAEVAAGRFREDLYYRLNVVPVRLPPLRERPEDIAPLAEAFLRQHARAQKRAVTGFSPAALEQLRAYAWPGNVRELMNEIERLVTVWEGGAGDAVEPSHLSEHIRAAAAAPERLVEELEVGDIKTVVAALVERAERRLIAAALKKTDGNRARAAELLGLTREGLRKKMLRYDVE